jgi:hypothetical protein
MSLKLKLFLKNYLLVEKQMLLQEIVHSNFHQPHRIVLFLISLRVIAYYSSVLEPVVTKLQGTNVNLYSVHTFVKTELLGILNKHRENSIEYFNTFFEEITKA